MTQSSSHHLSVIFSSHFFNFKRFYYWCFVLGLEKTSTVGSRWTCAYQFVQLIKLKEIFPALFIGSLVESQINGKENVLCMHTRSTAQGYKPHHQTLLKPCEQQIERNFAKTIDIMYGLATNSSIVDKSALSEITFFDYF